MMDIIITDLTRFTNPDIVCIAGINPTTNECIRPMPYLTTSKCHSLNILPGAILSGNFTKISCTAPHTEDRKYRGRLRFKRPCSAEEFSAILKASESQSAEEGFSVEILDRQKHIPDTTPPQKSIITISVNPLELRIVPDSFNPGKIKVIFFDKSGHEFWYHPITDLGFHNYAERNKGDDFSDLNDFIHSQSEIYVRLGLSRVYEHTDGRKGFWIQVNGIYTFPDFLEEIRCYTK